MNNYVNMIKQDILTLIDRKTKNIVENKNIKNFNLFSIEIDLDELLFRVEDYELKCALEQLCKLDSRWIKINKKEKKLLNFINFIFIINDNLTFKISYFHLKKMKQANFNLEKLNKKFSYSKKQLQKI